jgi:hypothetical protein
MGSSLGFDHWTLNNKESYFAMSNPVFEAYRVHVLDSRGHHRALEAVLRDVLSTVDKLHR